MFKKLLTICLCGLLTLSLTTLLVACDETATETSTEETTPTTTQFTISFYDENGNLLESKKWNENSTPSYAYSKTEDQNYTYSFNGWSLTLGGEIINPLLAITKDASYYAIVTKTKKTGQINFPQNENNVTALKTIACTSVNNLYNSKTSSLTPSEKLITNVLRSVAIYLIDNVDGNLTEVKTKLNAIYQDFNKNINKFTLNSDTFETAKEDASIKLQALYNSYSSIYNSVPSTLLEKYNSYKSSIENLSNSSDYKETLDGLVASFVEDTISDITSVFNEKINALKTKATNELDTKLNALISKISDEELKASVNTFKTTELNKINAVESLDDIQSTLTEVTNDTTTFIQSIAGQELTKLKTKAINELDTKLNALISKISDEELKASVNTFKTTELNKINAVDSLDDIQSTLTEVANDTTTFVADTLTAELAKLKTKAINELDTAVNNAISKLKTQSLKDQLTTYYNEQKELIENIDSLETAKTNIDQIKNNTIEFAISLVASQTEELRNTVKGYIQTLKNTMQEGPSSYIPNSMKAGSSIVNLDDVTYDFTNFVNVSDILYGGYGEQWNMVLTNIEESERFYKILATTNSVFEIAITEINEYLGSTYAESPNYTSSNDNYSINLTFNDNILSLDIEYKTSLENSYFGSVCPTISMVFDTEKNEKIIKITLTETNALKCVTTENKYEFALNYGINALSRTAYCSFEKGVDDSVSGHIYEYVTATVAGKQVSTNSCADFYIGTDYVSIVGNKASGMVGFAGYINELYKTSEGKLLGYEVQETLTILSVESTYHTLWFNLDDISGITSVKVTEKTNDNKNDKNANNVYINGNENLFVPTFNKKIAVKTSRKYDIELRKQYFYYKDELNNVCKIEVEVPMMFIQQDNDKDTNFTDYPANVLSENGITSQVTINSSVLDRIITDHATIIATFIENKELINANSIKSMLN